MSISNLANACSHLNNVNKARLPIAAIPNTKLHLKLAVAFLGQGLISTVVRGSTSPPPPHLLLSHPTVDESGYDVPSTEQVTQSNVASRRLWLGLKYWQNEPVLGKLALVTKPKRHITLDIPGLKRVTRGMSSGPVAGMRSPGECMFMLTNIGLLESRQCLERNVGGLVLCRMTV